MFTHKRIKVGKRYVEAFSTRLLTKQFILLKGRRGYVMCGYLNLAAAEKFNDCAAMVVGVASIREAVNGRVAGCTRAAKEKGIYAGQPVKDALALIA